MIIIIQYQFQSVETVDVKMSLQVDSFHWRSPGQLGMWQTSVRLPL